jgi:hypothetical protein
MNEKICREREFQLNNALLLIKTARYMYRRYTLLIN